MRAESAGFMQEDAACGMLDRMNDKLARKLPGFRQAARNMARQLDQWKWRWFAFRLRRQAHRNVDFDQAHGIETAMEVPLEAAGVASAEAARGNGIYRPLTEQLFRAAMASINIEAERFTFVDIGSGKGKVLFMAADLPFRRVLGIEYARALHEVAVRNIASYRSAARQCSVIESVHADALQYAFPDGPLVLFIFNALPREVMRELLLRLDNGIAADAQRPLFLIYTNLRTVAEVRGVFSGLTHFKIVRQLRNYIVIGNAAARARPA
jgi:SAM-dependent methyltransferase